MSKLKYYMEIVTVALGGNDRSKATRLRKKMLGNEIVTIKNYFDEPPSVIYDSFFDCLNRIKQRQIDLQIGMHDKRFNIPKLMASADYKTSPVATFIYAVLALRQKQKHLISSFDKYLIKMADNNTRELEIITRAVWEAYIELCQEYCLMLDKRKIPSGTHRLSAQTVVSNAWSMFESVAAIRAWIWRLKDEQVI